MTNEEMKMLTEADARSRSNTHRIDKVERRQDNLDALVTSVATLATEQEHIKDDVTEIKSDVKTLTSKPGNRWDSLVDKAIWAVCGGVLAWLLSTVLGAA